MDYYQIKRKPPGQTLLLIAGILYIVAGAWGVIINSGGLISSDYWDRVMPINSGISWSVVYGIGLVFVLYYIFIGIMAIINRGNLKMAYVLMILGFVDVVYEIFNVISANTIFAAGGTGIFTFGVSWFTFMYSLILPALYIFGAHRNHKEYREEQLTGTQAPPYNF